VARELPANGAEVENAIESIAKRERLQQDWRTHLLQSMQVFSKNNLGILNFPLKFQEGVLVINHILRNLSEIDLCNILARPSLVGLMN